VVPQFPEKKKTQRTLFGRVAPPTHEKYQSNVQFHIPRIKIKPTGNKKESKTIKSKRKTGKPKHYSFPKVVQDDCKESAHLACSLYIQELRNLVKEITK
jgi:hypothetical protein